MWAGVVPLQLVAGEAIADSHFQPGLLHRLPRHSLHPRADKIKCINYAN
ncbi:hypothetical protein OGM63_05240 [Plectonema radiosum NIES-515]|uniref:Uncharacterized protein n=1 Tax=Plectonema radiosum NIES-515 TaxID=2986073 RepID=A0ABT3AUX9_9CYAN|nr:hypothetical protein [Plectonema radiosum]MCV3212938.1 hypothetical protein [Plectonema radiosum NIES-515]